MMLESGTAFPAVTGKNTEGEETNINDLIAGSWAVVLFYRGHW